MKPNCSFCGDPIVRDRYNLALEGERQNVNAPSGKWEKFTEHPREDICSKCFAKITEWIGAFLDHFREHKGSVVTTGD